MSEEYLRGLKDALKAAETVGPTAYAYSVAAVLTSKIMEEEGKLKNERRRAENARKALRPRYAPEDAT